MTRQQGGVVDDGAMFGVVDDLHGDELGTEGQDVELGTRGLVLSHHLWDGLTLHTPAGELEDGHAILLSLSSWKKIDHTEPCKQWFYLHSTKHLNLRMIFYLFFILDN